ncbi:MAG TPA: MFS transporter [Acidimicrobiales bacterium]|jgi:MFS family permease|nr:MFS transporter [Acidimicrobiales bacterium]
MSRYLLAIGLVVMLAGLLFGYDQGVISGALSGIDRKPLAVAALLAILQQLTGINAIIYCADTIFAAAGFNNPTCQSLATLWAVGAVNVVARLIAVFWVDRFGRKSLFLLGSAGMCVGVLIVAGAFFELQKVTSSERATPAPAGAGVLALIGLVVFIASFAFSLGPSCGRSSTRSFRLTCVVGASPSRRPSTGSPPGWWPRPS